jgi:peptide/nickel transport system substrate-binding protein
VPSQSPIELRRPEYDSTIPIIKYDLEAAKQLLTQAGWSDSDGDGILDKVIDGKKTKFDFKILLNSGNKRRESMALIFVQALKKIGINASTSTIDWALFLNRTRDGDYDAYIGGWAGNVTEGDMYQIWHSKSAERGGSNYVKFRNQRVDQLIEQIRGEFDFAKRKAMYKEIQQVINDEQPYNFLVTEKLTGGYHERFQNAQFYAPRPCYNPAWWWVPQGMQKYEKNKKVAAVQ